MSTTNKTNSKKIILISIVSLAIIISLIIKFTSFDSSSSNNTNKETDSIEKNTTIATTSDNKSVNLANELANEFTLESGTSFSKKLEDAWKANPYDEEIAAMYHYHNAKFYEDIGQNSLAINSMKNISPNYNGVMSDEIIAYGISLFGSVSSWSSDNEEKNDHKQNISNYDKAQIKSWIEDRYEYYDNIEGSYCGDKYTETIFREAASKFGLTYDEIYNIWSDLPV